MSFRKEREKASSAAGEAAPRIKFDDAPQGEPAADLGTKSPRGGSGRSALRSSGGASSGGGGGVVFKLNLPGSSTSSSSSTPSSTNASPSSSSSSSSSSSKSAFTPRSMLNKVKHTLSLASDDMSAAAPSPGDADEPTAKEKKRGSSRHKRSRSMGDAKATAAAVVVPRDADAGHHQQQAAAAGSPHKSGSSVMRRKGSTASAHAAGGGSFLSFSSSSTKLIKHDYAAAESIERSASDAAVMTTAATGLHGGEAGDDADELDAQPGEGGGAEGKEGETSGGGGGGGQRRKWGSLQRRNNSLVIKKSSTADNIATQLAGGASSPSGKRNTIISEANGNRMDRTQRRRYRILVSSPRGGTTSAGGGGAEEGGEGELDPDADALGDDFDSDSDDSAEESIQTSEERKRSHTLAAGAKGLLKTPRFFHKDSRDKRVLPQGESDPGFSFRPSLDEGRHRRTNSTDISFLEPGSEDVHLQTVHMRYKEMEDLQLGGKERRERNKRLSVHVDQVLAHRPSYDSLVHRGILKEWSEPSAKTLQDFPAHLPPLVWSAANNTAGKIDGWNVERGTTQDLVFGAHSALEDEGYVPFYETHFYKSEYTTWWGVDGEFGPIIICIHKEPVTAGEAEGEAQNCSTADPSLFSTSDSGVPTISSSSHSGPSGILRRLGEKATGGKPAGGLLSLYRVLIQSKKGGKQLFIRSTEKSAEKFKALKTALGAQGYLTGEVASFNDIKFKKLKDLDIREDLLYVEKKFFSTDYKFGVLYVKNGQNENQMFSNLATDASPEFEKFLALMGEKITLKGFKGYTGGLDTKADTTGVESVYTEFKNQRIMYHVSTLLPFYPRDEQQVERKRHLGNDIVVIVFVEPGAQFDPTPMKTQFNHIYCVVCAEKLPAAAAGGEAAKAEEGATRVRIEFAVKQGVRPFGPPLPDPSETHFQLDTNLREFLLSKLVNSERAALKAPAFASKMEKTRKIFIEQLIDTKILKK